MKAAVIATKCYTNYDRHSQWLSCQLFYKQKIISLLPPLLTARPSCFPREGSATQWVVVRGGKSIVYFRYPRRSSQAYSLGKSGPKQSIPMMRTKKNEAMQGHSTPVVLQLLQRFSCLLQLRIYAVCKWIKMSHLSIFDFKMTCTFLFSYSMSSCLKEIGNSRDVCIEKSAKIGQNRLNM